MEPKEFARLENACQSRFMEEGSCFHVCSQENHPVLFHNEDEFKAAMNIVAFVALLFPGIRIFTFEIMTNHFHFALSGEKSLIDLFLKTFVSKLASHPTLINSSGDLRNLSFNIHPIGSLNNLRNVIAYINRNGVVISPNESVFTYEWGANRFFFNKEALLRYESCGRRTTFRERRKLFHSDGLTSKENIIVLDDYVSPLCYCRIKEAQMFFRHNRHYLFSVSRNIEASMEIAKMIGERIFYSDDDLFALILAKCSKKYNCRTPAILRKEAKVELAKELHFDYNAGNKQICRLLKLELPVVCSLFPEKG